jgi:hypothetical protein
MKKYKTMRYHPTRIEEIEVDRETDASVWLSSGRREPKMTRYHQYHDTWRKAHDSLKFKNRLAIDRYQDMLDKALQEADELQKMTEPTDGN